MLTAADLAGRKGVNSFHYDTPQLAVWRFDVEGVPRLGGEDAYVRRERRTVRTWLVDGKAMPDLDTALAVLNGKTSIEEVEEAMKAPPPAERPKKSLTAQIAEIDYELAQREKVYAGIIAGHPGRRAELELHVETMKAVRQTLVWLLENEDLIKQRWSY
jgi:hypothetical protein